MILYLRLISVWSQASPCLDSAGQAELKPALMFTHRPIHIACLIGSPVYILFLFFPPLTIMLLVILQLVPWDGQSYAPIAFSKYKSCLFTWSFYMWVCTYEYDNQPKFLLSSSPPPQGLRSFMNVSSYVDYVDGSIVCTCLNRHANVQNSCIPRLLRFLGVRFSVVVGITS